MQKMCKSSLRNLHILNALFACVLRGTRTLDPLIKSQLTALRMRQLEECIFDCYNKVIVFDYFSTG